LLLASRGPKPASVERLFVLELNAGRIHSMNPDGSDKKTIVTDCRLCDGIVVDVEARHIYWTNMGVPTLGRARSCSTSRGRFIEAAQLLIACALADYGPIV
jgi:hypothetical protein